MNELLVIYVLVFVLTLAMVLLEMRNDGTLSQKMARVRVRIDEKNRRNLPDPPEEDAGPGYILELLVLSIILMLIGLLLIKV